MARLAEFAAFAGCAAGRRSRGQPLRWTSSARELDFCSWSYPTRRPPEGGPRDRRARPTPSDVPGRDVDSTGRRAVLDAAGAAGLPGRPGPRDAAAGGRPGRRRARAAPRRAVTGDLPAVAQLPPGPRVVSAGPRLPRRRPRAGRAGADHPPDRGGGDRRGPSNRARPQPGPEAPALAPPGGRRCRVLESAPVEAARSPALRRADRGGGEKALAVAPRLWHRGRS